jgi:hypothetical protein
MKEDNFGQSIWDKSVILLGTSWKIHWEVDGNEKQNKNHPPTPPPPKKKKKPGGPHRGMLHCLTSLT